VVPGAESEAVIRFLVSGLELATAKGVETSHGLDVNFTLSSAYLVFMMQLG
jgi:hypothetical protein